MANGGIRKKRRRRRTVTPKERARLRALRQQFGLGEFRGRGSPSRTSRATPRRTRSVARRSNSRVPSGAFSTRKAQSPTLRRLVSPMPDIAG